MRKHDLNFSIDTLSFLAMLTLFATGLLMKLVLPPGSGGKQVWGLGRHAWGDLHFWVAVALVALIVLHVTLHWAWVYAASRRAVRAEVARGRDRRRERTAGLALLVVLALLVTGFLGAARTRVVGGGGEDHGGVEAGGGSRGAAAGDAAPR